MIKRVGYARNSEELKYLRQNGVSEVILGHQELSRLGNLNSTELHLLAEEARRLDVRPILEWDILMTTAQFESAVALIQQLRLDLFSAIRVQDVGAFEYVMTHLPKTQIQLNLETGNHNLESVRRWCDYGAGRLDRIILSIQLPKARLAHMIENISVPVEVMGLGPILLLYTPRHLLSNQLGPAPSDLKVLASNEDSMHAGFRVIENGHGTLVFHSKDYCLVEQIPELKAIHVAAFRIDRRLEDQIENPNGFLAFQASKVTRCFFQANATDVLFKKLKNTKIQRQDAGYVGEVAETSKGKHTIIRVTGRLRKIDQLRFINPLGIEKTSPIESLQNLDQVSVDEILPGDFAVIPYIKGITQKSAVYLSTDK